MPEPWRNSLITAIGFYVQLLGGTTGQEGVGTADTAVAHGQWLVLSQSGGRLITYIVSEAVGRVFSVEHDRQELGVLG